LGEEYNISKNLIKKDKTVFESVFKEHYAPLVSFAYRYLQDQDEAEEIVQETFYKLWSKADSLDIKTTIKAYLFGAVRNACLNHIKHVKVVREHEAYSKSVNKEGYAEDPLKLSELQERVNSAIDKLPEKCKEVFLLSRMEEKKYKEIAETLGISIKTVENQMGKALKVLRDELSQYMPILLLIGTDWINFLIEIGVKGI